ncbi:MAG: CD3324 family protein [Patescibacteria group bacterium]
MYRNAERILPRALLQEIQKYVQGQEIYIPRCSETRLGWGELNGTRAFLAERNWSILRNYQEGASIEQLMGEYHLSYDSIRKIVQRAKREQAV